MIDSPNPHHASSAITTRCRTSPGGSRATSLHPVYLLKTMKVVIALFSPKLPRCLC